MMTRSRSRKRKKRCRRYLAVAGMYFSFSEELARENDTDAMRKGIEVLEKAAGENMEGQWEAVIWQRLADACYLGGKSGDGGKRTGLVPGEFSLLRTASVQQTGWKPAEKSAQGRRAGTSVRHAGKSRTVPQRGRRNSGNGGGYFLSADQKRWEEAG